MVFGDRRPHLVALFFADEELPAAAPGPAIQAVVDRWNASQPRHQQVVRWAWSDTPLTPEAGTLTPTLKVQRAEVARQFASLVDTLYAD